MNLYYTLMVGENSFWMCGIGAHPESPRSKFAVLGCETDSLCSSEFTCTKWFTELDTTVDASKIRNTIVSCYRYCTDIAWQLILNHMTVITKVGTSYVDHISDETPEVNSFSHKCYQALSSPRFWGESLGTRLGIKMGSKINRDLKLDCWIAKYETTIEWVIIKWKCVPWSVTRKNRPYLKVVPWTDFCCQNWSPQTTLVAKNGPKMDLSGLNLATKTSPEDHFW